MGNLRFYNPDFTPLTYPTDKPFSLFPHYNDPSAMYDPTTGRAIFEDLHNARKALLMIQRAFLCHGGLKGLTQVKLHKNNTSFSAACTIEKAQETLNQLIDGSEFI
jgi:hypothetical protein